MHRGGRYAHVCIGAADYAYVCIGVAGMHICASGWPIMHMCASGWPIMHMCASRPAGDAHMCIGRLVCTCVHRSSGLCACVQKERVCRPTHSASIVGHRIQGGVRPDNTCLDWWSASTSLIRPVNLGYTQAAEQPLLIHESVICDAGQTTSHTAIAPERAR